MVLRVTFASVAAIISVIGGFLANCNSGFTDTTVDLAVTTLYHQDLDHPWNGVHAALFMRVGPDGRVYGEDRLEPLLWKNSNYLRPGTSSDRAIECLERFVREKGETLFEDPLKKAILQRDLWLVANWLASNTDSDAENSLLPTLAKIIHRLALTPDQISKLPDNYALAVASKNYAESFDPEKPGQSYMPPDLFKPNGPWVCVGRTDGLTAPFHLTEGGVNQFTNSIFLIFLKLPAGQDATLDFLNRLADFDKPYFIPNTDENTKRRLSQLPNPALPQWPKGTGVLLVRRAMLINSYGKMVASPLTESVQLRTMRTDMPEFTKNTVDTISLRKDGHWQAFSEFQLQRKALFAHVTDGLVDVSDVRDFKTGFNSHGWDVFEEITDTATTTESFTQSSQQFTRRDSCSACHNYPGVYSFNSIRGFAFGGMQFSQNDGENPKPHPLAEMTVAKVEEAAIKWKEAQPAWNAIQKQR